jgi:hypothetical protein
METALENNGLELSILLFGVLFSICLDTLNKSKLFVDQNVNGRHQHEDVSWQCLDLCNIWTESRIIEVVDSPRYCIRIHDGKKNRCRVALREVRWSGLLFRLQLKIDLDSRISKSPS